ncbi:MAG: hypothetical protein ACK5M0_10795 [Bacteroidales bacterium]
MRSRQALKVTNNLFRDKYVITVLLIPFVIIVSIIIIAVMHGTKLEIEYVGNYIGLVAVALSSYLVSAIVYIQNGKRVTYVIDLILVCFSIQTIIIILAQVSPAVLKFVQLFQSDALLHLDREPLFRRLLLSSAGFYGIGLVYGLTYILLAHKIIITKKVSLGDFLNFCLLFIGNMYTARTGFVGLLFALFYIVMKRVGGYFKFKLLIKSVLLLIVFVIVGMYILPKNIINMKVLNFAFEMFMNDKLETGSSNGLKTMWDRDVPISTFFVGDGIMYNKDGSYYMHTDVGYLRNIFFGGIFFFFFFFFLQVYIIACPLYRSENKRLLLVTLILYLLALHVKGEAIMFSRVLLSEMYLFLFVMYYDTKGLKSNKIIKNDEH